MIDDAKMILLKKRETKMETKMFNRVYLCVNIADIRRGVIPGKSTPFTSFSLATDSYMGSGADKRHFAAWHNVALYGETTVLFDRAHIDDGDMLIVEGRIAYQKREDKVYTSIYCDRFHKLPRTRTIEAVGLGGADLSGANLSGADLSASNLNGANLSGADLSDADLSYASFHGTRLENADLRGADLRNAYLSTAHLANADLRGADLRGAVYMDDTLSKSITDETTLLDDLDD